MAYEFGSDRPNLNARLHGLGVFTATPGQSTHYHEVEFDCLFNGIEFMADNANIGDNLTFELEYIYGETWKRYQRFGKEWNIFSGYPARVILFPTRPKDGMRFKIVYNNVGESDVKFVANVFTYSDYQMINTEEGEEGTDW